MLFAKSMLQRSASTGSFARCFWTRREALSSMPHNSFRGRPQHACFFHRAVSSDKHATCSSLGSATATAQQVAYRADLSGAGSIEVVVGPMFAGKTSELLRRISMHEEAGRRVLAVKSDKDTRYGAAHLKTHDGKSRACCAVSSLSQLKERWLQDYNAAEVIAIDEAQFFPDLMSFCRTAADEDDKRVIVAGLDGDFRRARFGQVLDLMPQADSITKLASRCTYCEAAGQQRAALFSLRIAADERQEVVGGADKYAPVCRKHYNALSKLRQRDEQALAVGS